MWDWQPNESLRGFFLWLQGLSPGSASFLGSFTGASIGLFALLIGALLNAHLYRRRDDRLRRAEARAAATALKAELTGINQVLMQNIANTEAQRPPPGGGYYVPDLLRAYEPILTSCRKLVFLILIPFSLSLSHMRLLNNIAKSSPHGRNTGCKCANRSARNLYACTARRTSRDYRPKDKRVCPVSNC